jgi:D-alanyl-D-alanine carboxypeptidase
MKYILIILIALSMLWGYSHEIGHSTGETLEHSGSMSVSWWVLPWLLEKKNSLIAKNIRVHKKYDPLPFYDDTSIYRFVSRETPLTDRDYEPDDLVSISGAYISTAGRGNIKLRKEARDALWKLAKDFHEHFWIPLTVISTYRSAEYQKRLWDLGRCTDTLCAPPGSSEHQLGLAIDVFDATNEDDYMENRNYKNYVEWFQKYAYRYGWHQSYQNGEEVDHYQIEPWHWRYLGVDMATKLQNLGWSYTEYVRFQEMLQKKFLY